MSHLFAWEKQDTFWFIADSGFRSSKALLIQNKLWMYLKQVIWSQNKTLYKRRKHRKSTILQPNMNMKIDVDISNLSMIERKMFLMY